MEEKQWFIILLGFIAGLMAYVRTIVITQSHRNAIFFGVIMIITVSVYAITYNGYIFASMIIITIIIDLVFQLQKKRGKRQ